MNEQLNPCETSKENQGTVRTNFQVENQEEAKIPLFNRKEEQQISSIENLELSVQSNIEKNKIITSIEDDQTQKDTSKQSTNTYYDQTYEHENQMQIFSKDSKGNKHYSIISQKHNKRKSGDSKIKNQLKKEKCLKHQNKKIEVQVYSNYNK